MTTGFCPQCGQARTGSFRFCRNCAFDYDSVGTPAAATANAQPGGTPASTTPASPAAPAAPSKQGNATAEPAATPKRSWWGRRSLGAKIAIIVLALLVVFAIAAPRDDDGTGAADPTSTPRPTASPGASTQPTAQATLQPATATPGPAFADIALTGSGDSVPRFSIPEGAVGIAVMTHTGSSNFAVFSLAEDGTNNELLVNTIANYSGTVLFDAEDGMHSVAFDVTASGAWTITIKPITAARIWDGTSTLSGRSDDVIHIDPNVSGFATVDITHTGESNFAVFAYGPDGRELLVNEVGNYSGESLLADGTFLLQVTADGTWGFTPT